MNPVVVLHGWSDTSKSFHPLADFLRTQGFEVVDLWLGDYISLDDDVAVEDVAKRMHVVLFEKQESGELASRFDLIVHSTGGLVARHWLADYYAQSPDACPVKRLVMLAPANFGSPLAHLGQSLLGRVVKGWNNWFHTGKRMLDQLELGSPYQWHLAERDLLVSPKSASSPSLYGSQGVLPFVIVGSHPYPRGLRQIVNENGGDGTVRVAAASLNCYGMTIRFDTRGEQPMVQPWKRRFDGQVPLAVLPDRTHGSVTDPDHPDISSNPIFYEGVGKLILTALSCEPGPAYEALAGDWERISKMTGKLSHDADLRSTVFGTNESTSPDFFHRYFQVLVHVIDDHGADVEDFFLEFTGPENDPRNDAIVYFQNEVLEHVHVCKKNPSYRCFYVDRTDMMTNFYAKIAASREKELRMSLSANPLGENVHFFANTRVGARGSLQLHVEDEAHKEKRFLRRNATHLVEIVIPRCPADNVFKLKRYQGR